ncbi:hypothetical protein JXA85_08255 [Candidatus Woesearchaeota archaeon]|nr:hypothetical protein [Candidatus Woesearchaeota archaeon]
MKKSQIQIGETITVLVVFMILIIIGMIVFFGFERSRNQGKEKEQSDLSANEIAMRAMFLPEISCSNDNIPVHSCFDRIKLEKSKSILEANQVDVYYNLFLYSNITVSVVFPQGNPSAPVQTYEIYSNLPKSYTSRTNTLIPVTIFEPMAEKGNEYSFGLLKVEVFK